MVRNVQQINIALRRGGPEDPRPFSDFAASQNVVLLGDPGSGKSHLFRETAAAEGARFVTARAFLVTPIQRLKGQALYIDGLDERRAGRGDTIDTIVQKLFEVEPTKVRISCRVADWLGETDLAALNPFFEIGGTPAVLLLERLSTEEQRAVLVAQALTRGEADAFLAQAQGRGLTEFLDNPQNLLMLFRAVQGGTWPATRHELFNTATSLMLKETDPSRARAGAGVYTAEELAPVAGAIFAARLISDVEAISLADQEGSPDIPGYRSVLFYDPSQVQAALGRRVFVAASEPETVDYAHRTTAEFLAAKWLADRVRAGLPLGRLMALMGVDGVPAPELRGLHAWLPVHLSEHAEQLIDADPYGVLTYGDASTMSKNVCAYLLKALARLSQKNPWFRSGAWQSPSIGALAREDMEEELRAILNSPDAGFGIRSLAVDALATGKPLPSMIGDLAAVLVREASPYAERSHALTALFRLGDAGKAVIVDACQNNLADTTNSLRIRALAIEQLYGEPYGPDDVIALVNNTLNIEDRAGTGLLWGLSDTVPLADLPIILDGIKAISRVDDMERRNAWEVASFYTRSLIRVWKSDLPFEPARALTWLRTRHAYAGTYSGNTDELRGVIATTPERLQEIADSFLENVVADDNRWFIWHELRELTFFELGAKDLLGRVLEQLAAQSPGTQKELFLYEAAFSLVYAAVSNSEQEFELLYDLPSSLPHLLSTRDASVTLKLPEDHYRWRLRRKDNEEKYDPEAQRAAFASNAEAIRNGMHIGWLGWAAFIYFGMFSDVDEGATPRERLLTIVGDANSKIALAGLEAMLQRLDVPTFDEMMEAISVRKTRQWWHGLVAGLNERWQRRTDFEGVPQDLLRSLVAFNLVSPVALVKDGVSTWLTPPWKQWLLDYQPDLVRDAYMAVVRTRLKVGDQTVEGMRELLTEPAFEACRRDIVITLLREFPNADPFRLDELIGAALELPDAHRDFLLLAGEALSGAVTVDQRQRDLWLTAAYMLAPNEYQEEVEHEAKAKPGLVFDLRDRSGFAHHQDRPSENALSLAQLEFMARLTGALYPAASHPSSGWGGDTNPWDASEHFRRLISMISANPSQAASDALLRLEADSDLSSYSEPLRHDLANQQQLRRDADYDRPDWEHTIKSLENGAPATVADLHALLINHLHDVRQQIERDNADIYKSFWNLDPYSRIVDPRPEEACRDFLVFFIRPQLAPFGITVEPEGHMAGDRRADISVAMPGKKILCELKRAYHADVWTAAEKQLDRFYAHDPEAKGFGIYCVFWFGDKRPTRIPKPPKNLDRPKSAADMEQMLRGLLSEEARKRIAVIVIDVSGPPS
jgi:predicted NACHT family NTPase